MSSKLYECPATISIAQCIGQCQRILSVPEQFRFDPHVFSAFSNPYKALKFLGVFREVSSGGGGYTFHYSQYELAKEEAEGLVKVTGCKLTSEVRGSVSVAAFAFLKIHALVACCAKLICIYVGSRDVAVDILTRYRDAKKDPFVLLTEPKLRTIVSRVQPMPRLCDPEQQQMEAGTSGIGSEANRSHNPAGSFTDQHLRENFKCKRNALFNPNMGKRRKFVAVPVAIEADCLFEEPLQPYPNRRSLKDGTRNDLIQAPHMYPSKALNFLKVQLAFVKRCFFYGDESEPQGRINGFYVRLVNDKICNLDICAFANHGRLCEEACCALFLYQSFGEKETAKILLSRWLQTAAGVSVLYAFPKRHYGPKFLSLMRPDAIDSSQRNAGKPEFSQEMYDLQTIVRHKEVDKDAALAHNQTEVLNCSLNAVENSSVSESSNCEQNHHPCQEDIPEVYEVPQYEIEFVREIEQDFSLKFCANEALQLLKQNKLVESVEVVRCAVGVESGRAEVELCVNNRHSFVATSPSSLSSAGCGVEAAFSAVLAEALGVMGRMQRQGSPHCVIAATTPDLALLASLLQDHSGLSLDSLHLRFQFLFPSKSWVATLTMDDHTFCSKDTHNNQTDAVTEVLLQYLVNCLEFEVV